MSTAHPPEHADIPPPKLEEVGEGVFAYIQLDGSWGLNNTGFLVGGDAVTAIDTCFTERRSLAFRDAIRSVTDAPVRTLINTHHHGDHTHGNFVFAPGATIIGHELCREEVIATGLGTGAMFPGVEWGDLRVEPPSVTFADRLNVWVGDLKVELIHVGPAHTTNDVLVWLPERRLLFTGDLVFNGGTPFVVMGSVQGSIDAVQAIRDLAPETIVPGHGSVCGPEVLDTIEGYLRFVQDAARRGHEAGVSPLALAQETDLGEWSDLLDRERFVGNLHRAYSELDGDALGAPLPLMSIVPDMVTYNGGQMPRCLA